MIRIHIVFSGHVQHCGFRYYSWKMVKKVGDITGWVKNRADGKVEMEVQGSRENVDRLMALIRKGTNSIRVDQERNIKMLWKEINGKNRLIQRPIYQKQ